MAFDGITIHALTHELSELLAGGRLSKIAQPEADELLFTIKSFSGNYRLILSANAGLPLVYLTKNNKPSPMVAPNFCMLLRKHISNGRILSITQPGLERVIDFAIEHLNEMGDLCHKHLKVELMGKYSNIIFTDDKGRIIDSIKRVNAGMSSIREVLPGADYWIPNTDDKKELLLLSEEEIRGLLANSPKPIGKAIYQLFIGISPQVAHYLCQIADCDERIPANELTESALLHLSHQFYGFINQVKEARYTPTIFLNADVPCEYGVFSDYQCLYPDATVTAVSCHSVSEMIENYYAKRDNVNRIRSRCADLRQIVHTLLERNVKKYELQEKQLRDTDKREQYRIYGELLSAYAYQIVSGSQKATVLNYYTNEEVEIPLDEDLSIQDNAQKYFAKYGKLKRTYEALSSLIVETKSTIEHLESIDTALDLATDYDDLIQIREEMVAFHYMKSHLAKGQKVKYQSKPLHYISSDGYDMYVGKNNFQNEEVDFKLAAGDDWWFHVKGAPGSHVIVKCNHEGLPDSTFEEAAALAAYYSKLKNQDKVEVDYVMRKHLKRVPGQAPGFVIYHTNYSMVISPDISKITPANE